MPNQSLSGKWRIILGKCCPEKEYGNCSIKGHLTVNETITALKSCLAEEIRGMKKEMPNVYKTCRADFIKERHDKDYNKALDDVLKLMEG